MNNSISFIDTNQYQQFSEFCDACRRDKYIGLCYGAPGVGKTLSAKKYSQWDKFNSVKIELSGDQYFEHLKADKTLNLDTVFLYSTCCH